MLTSTSSPPSSLHHPKLLHPKTPNLFLPTTHLTFPTTQNPNPKPFLTCRRHPSFIAAVGKSSPKVEEQKFSAEGLVTESLPNGMFRIKLDNADNIIGYISGKIRKSFIRILPGDMVKVEVSRYDTTRGRIVYRLRNTRDSN